MTNWPRQSLLNRSATSNFPFPLWQRKMEWSVSLGSLQYLFLYGKVLSLLSETEAIISNLWNEQLQEAYKEKKMFRS
jgi:hypothetical protein